jgi:hypothetical protein
LSTTQKDRLGHKTIVSDSKTIVFVTLPFCFDIKQSAKKQRQSSLRQTRRLCHEDNRQRDKADWQSCKSAHFWMKPICFASFPIAFVSLTICFKAQTMCCVPEPIYYGSRSHFLRWRQLSSSSRQQFCNQDAFLSDGNDLLCLEIDFSITEKIAGEAPTRLVTILFPVVQLKRPYPAAPHLRSGDRKNKRGGSLSPILLWPFDPFR